ncbi:ribonuclease H-like domain-containing protein [Tanacetum coccineum]
MVPRAVLMKSGLVSVNTGRQVNVAHSKITVNAARPIGLILTIKDKNVNTARPKAVVNAVKGNNVNAVKASACWVWKPKTKVIDNVSKHNSASMIFKKFNYVDAQGRSKTAFGKEQESYLVTVNVNAAKHNLLLLGGGVGVLQALVDGKKIIITESIVRRDLHLEDVEGVDCLPNATIFEQLTLMGYEKLSQKLTFYKAFFSPQWKFLIHTILQCLSSKTTAWNEFSSTMASAIICLATNQNFNFSKYIFESMVKNLDNVGKFLMYPRFVQVFLDKQLEGMQSHKRIYDAPSHTKKIFRNMKRVGKGFSGRVTPLFPTMVKQKSRRPKKKDTQIPQSSVPSDNVTDKAVNEEMDDSLETTATTANSLDAEQDRGKYEVQTDMSVRGTRWQAEVLVRDFCCSKGGLEDKILVPKPPQNCATCGDPVDGLYCRSCAFVRKCLNEGSPNTNTHHMVTRAKARISKPLARMNWHATTTSPIPRSYLHALRDPNWHKAMVDEYNALISNGTWALVPRPANVLLS